MSDLLGNLRSAGSSLRSLTDALGIVQGNLSNGSTPGYARRRVALTETTPAAIGLDPSGVTSLTAQTTRVQSLEESVWLQSGDLGHSSQLQQGLEPMVKLLEPTTKGSVSDSLQRLFSSFRTLVSAPTNSAARQQAVAESENIAAAINQTASTLQTYQTNYENQLQNTVTRVNQLVKQIAQAEKQARDAGSETLADTRVYGALEELSSLIDFKMLRGSDGSITLLGGGQVPLLQGGTTFALSVDTKQTTGGNRPLPQILDAFGNNVTNTFQGGEMAGLVDLTNRIIPSLIGGGSTTGSLNELAEQLGTQFNQALAPGKALFTWNTAPASAAALSFRVTAGFTDSDLPTSGATLTNLDTLSRDSTTLAALGGKTIQSFFTTQVQKLADKATGTTEQVSTSQSLLTQAQNLRTATSGVTLEQEAVELLQLQHTFQAVSRLISTVNDLVDSVLAIKR